MRYDADGERILASLPAVGQSAFNQAATFNATIKEALDRPGEGARLAVQTAALDARAALERLAEGDDTPFVLAITPRFVPPRRGAAELTLAPRPPPVLPEDRVLRLDAPRPPGGGTTGAVMPRYVPDLSLPRPTIRRCRSKSWGFISYSPAASDRGSRLATGVAKRKWPRDACVSPCRAPPSPPPAPAPPGQMPRCQCRAASGRSPFNFSSLSCPTVQVSSHSTRKRAR